MTKVCRPQFPGVTSSCVPGCWGPTGLAGMAAAGERPSPLHACVCVHAYMCANMCACCVHACCTCTCTGVRPYPAHAHMHLYRRAAIPCTCTCTGERPYPAHALVQACGHTLHMHLYRRAAISCTCTCTGERPYPPNELSNMLFAHASAHDRAGYNEVSEAVCAPWRIHACMHVYVCGWGPAVTRCEPEMVSCTCMCGDMRPIHVV